MITLNAILLFSALGFKLELSYSGVKMIVQRGFDFDAVPNSQSAFWYCSQSQVNNK